MQSISSICAQLTTNPPITTITTKPLSSTQPQSSGRTQLASAISSASSGTDFKGVSSGSATPSPGNGSQMGIPRSCWEVIDDSPIPCLSRGEKLLVAACMVEERFLTKYSVDEPEKVRKEWLLITYPITYMESILLNRICKSFPCFTGKKKTYVEGVDLMLEALQLKEFLDKREKQSSESSISPTASVTGGWFQVNNTIVPYVRRNGKKLLLLSVILVAANLFPDNADSVESVLCTQEECTYLRSACSTLNVKVALEKDTKLIEEFKLILNQNVLHLRELPGDKPLHAARFHKSGSLSPKSNLEEFLPNGLPRVFSRQSLITMVEDCQNTGKRKSTQENSQAQKKCRTSSSPEEPLSPAGEEYMTSSPLSLPKPDEVTCVAPLVIEPEDDEDYSTRALESNSSCTSPSEIPFEVQRLLDLPHSVPNDDENFDVLQQIIIDLVAQKQAVTMQAILTKWCKKKNYRLKDLLDNDPIRKLLCSLINKLRRSNSTNSNEPVGVPTESLPLVTAASAPPIAITPCSDAEPAAIPTENTLLITSTTEPSVPITPCFNAEVPCNSTKTFKSLVYLKRSIIGLRNNGIHYVLVESLNSVYFRDYPLLRFSKVLQTVLPDDIQTLEADEEVAFVERLKLKTNHLRCSSIVPLEKFHAKRRDVESCLKTTSNNLQPAKRDRKPRNRASISTSPSTTPQRIMPKTQENTVILNKLPMQQTLSNLSPSTIVLKTVPLKPAFFNVVLAQPKPLNMLQPPTLLNTIVPTVTTSFHSMTTNGNPLLPKLIHVQQPVLTNNTLTRHEPLQGDETAKKSTFFNLSSATKVVSEVAIATSTASSKAAPLTSVESENNDFILIEDD